MYPSYQHTFLHSISCKGVGIHSGKEVHLTLKPAPADHGIIFKRIDLDGSPEIPATYKYLQETRLCTRIGLTPKISVSTIEHIMAALAAFEIDNALIEIDGPEVPIMDGSSGPFIALLQCAGKVAQDKERLYIKVKESLSIDLTNRKVSLSPKNSLSIGFSSSPRNTDNLLDNQCYTYHHNWFSFKQDIATARTIAFYDEIAQLQANGLGLGGSLDNTVVLKEGKVLNEGGLRHNDEFARHKILDALGDLYLLGKPILGEFLSIGGGHALNAQMIQELLDYPTAFEVGSLESFGFGEASSWEGSSCVLYSSIAESSAG